MKAGRRVLWGVGLAVPLVTLGCWARGVASWRPVAVGKVVSCVAMLPPYTSQNYVLNTTSTDGRKMETFCTLFDTHSARSSVFRFPGELAAGIDGDAFWHVNFTDPGTASLSPSLCRLEVEGKLKEKRAFPFHCVFFDDYKPTVRILPEQNQVVLLTDNSICEWNYRNAQLRHQTKLMPSLSQALSRDAQSFIVADAKGFRVGDTRSGKLQKKIAYNGIRFFEYVHLSPHGRYALLDQATRKSRLEIVETSTGRRLWGLDLATNIGIDWWAISDDERTFFVPDGNGWNVFVLKTGVFLRRLPRISDISVAALSPDGKTLYSVAKGVLYRQRTG